MTTSPHRSFAAAAGLLAALVAFVALAGCGSGVREDPILRLSAAESMIQGKGLMERKKYREARKYLAHAFEVEPNSALGREALLLSADSYYFDGGTANWIQAEAKYRDFQNRFPTSDKAAYVQFQIGRSLAERMEKPDRDQKSAAKALQAFEDLMRLYPTSDYAAQAAEQIRQVRNNLARHEYMIGVFYLRYGIPVAAVSRLEELVADYPDTDQLEPALFHLGLAYNRNGQAAEARATFDRLRREFPQGEYAAKAPDIDVPVDATAVNPAAAGPAQPEANPS
jgi:outer membrane protein assembly factor BamD